MGLNDTVSAERVHIGFFGRRNVGKSSLVNAVTGQNLSVVSDVKGTTTDPVRKAMELLPLGPVMIIDTPGYDDDGSLGALRIEKTNQVLAKTDIAVLVVDSTFGLTKDDNELISLFNERKLPFVVVYNKADLLAKIPNANENEIYVSAKNNININELKEKIGQFAKFKQNTKQLLGDLLNKGDTVLLVIPIDESAPKGRLILPQQQVMREILDNKCIISACQPDEIEKTLANMKTAPKLVITDSQAFGKVSKLVPEDIMLTSFSILFARYKGDLKALVRGAASLSKLNDGDNVLISEGCTHHRQCNDIGTVKMPKWIENFTGKKLEFSFTSGGEFPSDLSKYSIIVHCGGCMLNAAEMNHRINTAKEQGIPIVNYGIAIAHIHGILKRSLEPFPDIYKLI